MPDIVVLSRPPKTAVVTGRGVLLSTVLLFAVTALRQQL